MCPAAAASSRAWPCGPCVALYANTNSIAWQIGPARSCVVAWQAHALLILILYFLHHQKYALTHRALSYSRALARARANQSDLQTNPANHQFPLPLESRRRRRCFSSILRLVCSLLLRNTSAPRRTKPSRSACDTHLVERERARKTDRSLPLVAVVVVAAAVLELLRTVGHITNWSAG